MEIAAFFHGQAPARVLLAFLLLGCSASNEGAGQVTPSGRSGGGVPWPDIVQSDAFDGFCKWSSAPANAPGDAGDGIHGLGPLTVYWNQSPAHGSHEFPVGTIILKESNQPDSSQRVAFAMVKRQPRGTGYNTMAVPTDGNGGRSPDPGNCTVERLWRGPVPPTTESYAGMPDRGLQRLPRARGRQRLRVGHGSAILEVLSVGRQSTWLHAFFAQCAARATPSSSLGAIASARSASIPSIAPREPRLERDEVVAALEHEGHPSLRRARGHARELARHPAEGVRRELHLRERIAGRRVEAGADEHELRRVALDDGQHDALERAARTRASPPPAASGTFTV